MSNYIWFDVKNFAPIKKTTMKRTF